MLGVYGCPGTLRTRLMLELTTAARREFFGGARGPWFELAQGREAFRPQCQVALRAGVSSGRRPGHARYSP